MLKAFLAAILSPCLQPRAAGPSLGDALRVPGHTWPNAAAVRALTAYEK